MHLNDPRRAHKSPSWAVIAALVLALLSPTAAAAGTPAVPPKLRIGVAYMPPPKSADTTPYTEEGFETALAQDIGRQLGASVALVPMQESGWTTALAEGQVDVVIARISGSADVLETVAEVLPAGFSSGQTVAMPTFTNVRRWSDLADRTLCVSEANGTGRRFGETLGAKLRVVHAPAEGLILLRTGQCDASIHDAALLDPLLRKREWTKFSATLAPAEPTDLVVAVAKAYPALAGEIRSALASIGTEEAWAKRRGQWAADVAFEVYLNQLGADCH